MGQGPAITIFCAALFALGSLAGCTSNGGPNNLGTIACAAPAGQTISPSVTSPCQVSIDFGDVAAGVQVSAAIQVQNAGASPLTFEALSGNLDPAFTIDSSALSQPLPPGGKITLAAYYQPATAGSYSSSVTIPTSAAGSTGISFQFTGQSFTAGLSVSPTSIDFGEVLVGTVVNKNVTLTNTSSIDIDGIISGVTGDPGDFTINGAPTALKKGFSVQVGLTYAPLGTGGASSGTAVFTFANATASVGLSGVSNSASLTASPSAINFGFVPTGTSLLGCTTVANPSIVDQVVTGVAGLMTAGGFAVAPTDDATPPNPIAFPLTIPATGSVQLCFTFDPTIIQQYDGQATLTNADTAGTNPVVQLAGWGGGPQISCSPTSLDFGDVVAGASVTQVVTCTNTGTAIATTNLTLGQPSASPAAFSAQFDPNEPYSAAGIVAGQSVEIDVTYAPAIGSPTAGMLSIPNNGGQGTTVEIPLTVDQVFPTACEFAILPPALDFGNIAQAAARPTELGSPSELAFEIQNQGTVPCLVGNLAIQGDTSHSFSIVSTSISPDLDAGTIAIPASADGGTTGLLVQVRFGPGGAGTFSAKADFSVLDAPQQAQTVGLTGSSQYSCLVVAPTSLDFGTLALGDAGTCNSNAQLGFTVFNQCGGKATVDSLTLQPGPGDAAAQFSAPQGPGLPSTLYSGTGNFSQATFALSFEPSSPGLHTGQVLVSDGTVSALVSLSGTAASEATQTDNFVAALPRADVLFMLDTSGSNANVLLPMLDGGLAAFVQDGAQIDYRFAVTTDNDYAPDATAEFGQLLPCNGCSVAGNAPEVIGPTTVPNGGTSADPATALGDLLALVPGSAQPSEYRDFFEALLLVFQRAPLAGVDFFRPGAYFAAVNVASVGGDDTSPALTWYQSFFQFEFPLSSLFSWNYAGQGVSIGTGLLLASDEPKLVGQMVSGTGGVAVNTQDPNWPTALSAIWTAAAAAGSHYTLSAMPLNGQSGITVTRNGMTVAQTGSGGANWTYDSFTNSVIFNASIDPPASGDHISVSYPVGCE